MNNATAPEYMVTTQKRKSVRITLDGVKTLNVEKVLTTFEEKLEIHPISKRPFKAIYKKKVDQVVESTNSFHLTQVTTAELEEYRRSEIPSFVLKTDDKLYYTKIPKSLHFINSIVLGEHQCAKCRHLSAASDEEGGCEKVRNETERIERYPWITEGYETFNTDHDSFVVTSCLHFENYLPHKKVSKAERDKIRLSLAQFYCDDVTNLKQVKKLRDRNIAYRSSHTN